MENTDNENVLKSFKRDLTDEIKRMPIEKLEQYGMSSYRIPDLKDRGIYTIGDLLVYGTDKLYRQTCTEFSAYYWDIRTAVMKMGLLFDEDHMKFEEAGISDEIALIPIQNLQLSQSLKSTLARRGGIKFLGDLLTIDYDKIMKIRNMGESGMMELKVYLHSLGYSLQNEESTLREIEEDYKEKGITMIHESLGLDAKTTGVLYRNNIYTVDDLMNFGPDVFELIGMGPVKKKKLQDAMSEKGISFGTDVVIHAKAPLDVSSVVRPTEDIVNRLKTENSSIKERIAKKEKLIAEYEKLLTERDTLIEREKKLDEEIEKKVAMTQSISVKEEGTGYGRK